MTSALTYRSIQIKALLSLIVACLASPLANAKPERASNFLLLDQRGKAHQLYYHKDAAAVVLTAHNGDGQTMGDVSATMDQLRTRFQAEAVKLFFINPNPASTRDQFKDANLSVLLDEEQLISREYNFTQAGEAVVINPNNWQIVYRGPVGEELQQMVQALTQDKPVEFKAVALNKKLPALKISHADNTVSYSKTIAPLLMEKCADCHRPEGIGPWAMTSYDMIKGFAPMIKEVVFTKRMPPWHADPHVNEFKADLSLSRAEKQNLINWINAGAPRGTGDDPLKAVTAADSQWLLGEPDMIVEFPSFDIPATGVLDYQFFEVPIQLPENKWVKAVQTLPGDRAVLHHSIVTFGEPADPTKPIKGRGDNRGNSLTDQQLMTFVPGNEHYVYPEETGLLITKGSSIFAQMHYTTSGKATTDVTRLGIYFRDDAPENVLRHYAIINPQIQIPAGDAEHWESAYYRFSDDAIIYSVFPHAHYRGASSKFKLRYPDGREELILSVPNYDFNWQRYFQLQEPKEVPAGTFLIHDTAWDNSAANPYNPDPNQEIRWGLQSWEEMLYGGVSYRYKKNIDVSDEEKRLQYRASNAIGYMDTNQDGELVMEELPEQLRKRIGLAFALLDADKSNGLNVDELKNFFRPREGNADNSD